MEEIYFWTAVRTSDLSILPPRFEARSIIPDFGYYATTDEICKSERWNQNMDQGEKKNLNPNHIADETYKEREQWWGRA